MLYDKLDPAAAFARWRKDRSLALNRIAVERLRRDPAALELARATLRRWRAMGPSNSDPYFNEWEATIALGVEATIAVLVEDTEHAADLRKCGPFACLVPNEERLAVLAEWAPLQPGRK